ncbi:MAG: hypothetical protein ACOYNL_08540 [Rickettsiales bacterium]
MADSVLTYLDGYCERAGSVAALGEPLNLFTNLFFILAAMLTARALAKREAPGRCIDLCVLICLLFMIGLGSGLWHLAPSRSTVLMDVVPITLFINLYILCTLRRLFAQSWGKVAFYWGLYFAAGLVAQATLPPSLLNGTIMYIPTYAMLMLLTLMLRKRDAMAGNAFTLALMVWTVSLMFRTIDMDICHSLGIGTHFLWHTLNAWVLWKLLMTLVKQKYDVN